ncbi:MAG: GNAT family N-acetyltransferase [Bdellovibrionaceae bacterium]|nr:GNAT family N-acetyltransferase [Pseudobdellovibrionaceae bacterium]
MSAFPKEKHCFLKKKDNSWNSPFEKENWFTGKNSAYVSQLAVIPMLKKNGLGTLLMDLCEDLAKKKVSSPFN